LFRTTQQRYVVKPEQPLAPGYRDVAAVVGYLHIGNQQVEQFALLALPNHFFVKQLTAALTQ
jgi:hypothetical protein